MSGPFQLQKLQVILQSLDLVWILGSKFVVTSQHVCRLGSLASLDVGHSCRTEP